MITEQVYNTYGLIAQLLVSKSYSVPELDAVAVAFNYLGNARKEYEDANPPQVETEAPADPVQITHKPKKKQKKKK